MYSNTIFILATVFALVYSHPVALDLPEHFEQENETTIDVGIDELLPGQKKFGDMILPEDFFDEDSKGAGIPGKLHRWTNNEVPYIIDPSLNDLKKSIASAMKLYHDNTCIKFVPFVNNKVHKHSIRLFAGTDCSSDVGMLVLRKEQPVSLQRSGCWNQRTILHELGHAIGLFHEHQRSDRDNYITVYIGNVQPGYTDQFNKMRPGQNQLFTGYDQSSIMHYGELAFSKDGKAKTMVAKKGKLDDSRQQFTALDIAAIKAMYNCP